MTNPAAKAPALKAAIVDTLPKCKCHKLAVGEYMSTQHLIGRKLYGGDPVPVCSAACAPATAPIRMYPYYALAAELNAVVDDGTPMGA